MNGGGMNSGRPKQYRYLRRDVNLPGCPISLPELAAMVAACERTGHAEDALLLRTVHRHQAEHVARLRRHGEIEGLCSDLAQALAVGQLERAAALRAELTAAGAVLIEHPDGAIEWANPLFGASAPLTEGPITHALRAHIDARLD